MQDYDELWNEYAVEFTNKLDSNPDGNWNKLDEIEQEIAALWLLVADMYNGGFDEFFLNCGYECYTYAMRGIKRIADACSGQEKTDCNEVYKLFDNTYTKVFARFENDDRIKSYGDIVEYLNDDDEKMFEETYEIFDKELGTIFCKSAYEFYCKNLKKTVN